MNKMCHGRNDQSETEPVRKAKTPVWDLWERHILNKIQSALLINYSIYVSGDTAWPKHNNMFLQGVFVPLPEGFPGALPVLTTLRALIPVQLCRLPGPMTPCLGTWVNLHNWLVWQAVQCDVWLVVWEWELRAMAGLLLAHCASSSTGAWLIYNPL